MATYLKSLRGQFILLLFLIAMPLTILTVQSGFEQRKQAAAVAQGEALRLARIAAQNQEFLLEQTKGFLLALAHTVGNDMKMLVNCQDVFDHLSETHFPYYTGFYLADLKGNLLCTSPGETPRIDICTHYAELIHATDFLISDYHLCKNTGRGTISIGYPVFDTNEQIIGVVNSGIDLEWFNQLIEEANLPEDSELIVFNQGRIIFTHYPSPRVYVGRAMPDNELTDTMLEQEEGTTEGVGFDGVHRLYAFVPLWQGENKVILTIGISADEAYAEVNRRLYFNLGMIVLVTFAAVSLTWYIGEARFLKPIQTIVKTTQKLANKDLSVRTRLPYAAGELGSLAHAVDQLAEALVLHEEERDQNERAIQEYAASLEQSNRELRDFNSIASHDLQEPVRKLQMYSDLLLARYGQKLDETGRKYLHTLTRTAGRMQQLILDLLDYSYVTTRASPFTTVELDSLLQEVVGDLEAQILKTGARIELQPLPAIQADASQLHHLFLNLLTNSLKFHKPEAVPEIQVYAELQRAKKSADPKNSQVKIYVADNGIGFDEKYLERIFQPFESLHTQDEYPGTGMGLAICRKIVERHNGSITAQSKPDQGAVFIVTLPLHQMNGGK